MSKRPHGPDSHSEGIAVWNKHAAQFGDSGGDGANSDEGDSRAAKRSRVKAAPRRAATKPQDKVPLPTLNYKNMGAVRELSKLYRLHGEGAFVQIVIPAQNLNTTSEKEVKGRHLWGTDIYTDDSDVVCALMHCGFYNASLKKPVGLMTEMNVVVQLLPPQQVYSISARNGIRSRPWWVGGTKCSYRIERCNLRFRTGETLDLPRRTDRAQELVPTFTPSQSERAMNTRGREANVERRQRRVTGVTIMYSLSNEPWLKYSMAAVADRGLKPSQWTSARLATQTLLLETLRTRYELSLVSEDHSDGTDTQGEVLYRLARCNEPLPMTAMTAVGVPLPESRIQVIHSALPWEQFRWSDEGLDVQSRHYPITRLHFTDNARVGTQSPSPGIEGTGEAMLNGNM